MASTLDFNDFIPGPNPGEIQEHYPTSRLILPVKLGFDLTDFTVEADYQSLVCDTISFDRSGNPNFAKSTLIGSFPVVEITGADIPVITDIPTGAVNLIIPENIYAGPLFPAANNEARVNPVITVISLTWISSDGFKDSFRQPLYISYEPDVDIGDPTAELDYVPKV